MNKIMYGAAICSLLASCSNGIDDNEPTHSLGQDLDVGSVSNLTLMQGNLTSQDEGSREHDSSIYTENGMRVGNSTIAVPTLAEFQRVYGLSSTGSPNAGEYTAFYYNRGDLGLGREMHCIDNLDKPSQTVACYVRNFAAGDDDSVFTFGESADIAFKNIGIGNAFATVAMVYSNEVNASSGINNVFFAVYNGTGTALLNAATLDRAGFAYEKAFNQGQDLSTLGKPGVNFNNHIPSNCMTCHGGQKYNVLGKATYGSLFLPFDLDNFDFDATHTRASQEEAFRGLNQIVRRVAEKAEYAANHGNPNPPIHSDVGNSLTNQIDGWYRNPANASTLPPCPTNGTPCFNSNYIPPGWDPSKNSASNPVSAGAAVVYQQVVRGACRNCHIVNNDRPELHFDSEVGFNTFQLGNVPASAGIVASNLKSYAMPHSLQSTRSFWLSPAPAVLENYYRSIGQADAADTLHLGSGGNVVTLDPHVIRSMNLDD